MEKFEEGFETRTKEKKADDYPCSLFYLWQGYWKQMGTIPWLFTK